MFLLSQYEKGVGGLPEELEGSTNSYKEPNVYEKESKASQRWYCAYEIEENLQDSGAEHDFPW